MSVHIYIHILQHGQCIAHQVLCTMLVVNHRIVNLFKIANWGEKTNHSPTLNKPGKSVKENHYPKVI